MFFSCWCLACCLPEGPPDAKHHPKCAKIDRISTKNRAKINRKIRHGMLAKCSRTLPKIQYKLRGPTLGKLSAGQAISGCGGLALASSIRRTPPGVPGVSDPVRNSHRSRRGFLSLPLRRPPPDRRTLRPNGELLQIFFFSGFFGAQKKP